jgi:hypothetical protein
MSGPIVQDFQQNQYQADDGKQDKDSSKEAHQVVPDRKQYTHNYITSRKQWPNRAAHCNTSTFSAGLHGQKAGNVYLWDVNW